LRDRHAVPLHEVGPGLAGEEEMVAQIIRSLAERKAASLTVAKDFLALAPSAPIKRLIAVVTKLMAAGSRTGNAGRDGRRNRAHLVRAWASSSLSSLARSRPVVVIAQIADGKKRQIEGSDH